MLVPVETELRELVTKIRTKPVSIKDIQPLLTRAADEITRLREFEFMYNSVSK